jgi:protein-ribulosamine 3-kinase
MLDQQEIYEQVITETLGPFAHLRSASVIAAGNHNQGIRLDTTEGPFS